MSRLFEPLTIGSLRLANQSETFIAALRRLGAEPFKLAANAARHQAQQEETA